METENVALDERIEERPNLSMVALTSFIASFVVARTFTSLFPKIIWEVSSYHVHHFWYGLAMLAIGGWLGISYESGRTNRIAAILFGAGGGLIADEIGLLLTLNDYWSGITYSAFILILTFASIFILMFRYSDVIRSEFMQFASSNTSLYLGVFVAAVSLAFMLETDNNIVIVVSGGLTVFACIVILSYFAQQILSRYRRRKFS